MSDLTPEEIAELSDEDLNELGLGEEDKVTAEASDAQDDGQKLNEDGLPIGVPLSDEQVRSQYQKSCDISTKARLELAALNNKSIVDALKVK